MFEYNGYEKTYKYFYAYTATEPYTGFMKCNGFGVHATDRAITPFDIVTYLRREHPELTDLSVCIIAMNTIP